MDETVGMAPLSLWGQIQCGHLLFDRVRREMDAAGAEFVDPALECLDSAGLGGNIGHAEPSPRSVHTGLHVCHRDTSYLAYPVPAATLMAGRNTQGKCYQVSLLVTCSV
ncbi:hypothetical protein ACIO52_17875 [Nocardia sp. NPDC087230]|uniref:hypothetical protein n=1 Tax=unclassified Nocardia TaxID=2637762 RepID=UPI00319E94BC